MFARLRVLALMLIASTLVLGLIAPYQHAPRGSAAAASQPPQSLSRRALGQRLLAGSALLVPRGAHALFESAAQSSLSSLANVQPKVKGVNMSAEAQAARVKAGSDAELRLAVGYAIREEFAGSRQRCDMHMI